MKNRIFKFILITLVISLLSVGCQAVEKPEPVEQVEEILAPKTEETNEPEPEPELENEEVITACEDPLRVAFVLSGAATDQGWAMSHDLGRKYVQDNLECVETISIESVSSGDSE